MHVICKFKNIVILSFVLTIYFNSLYAQSVQTVIGTSFEKSGSNALSVRLGQLQSSVSDVAGNIYYSDNYDIYKRDILSGKTSRIAGMGVRDFSGIEIIDGTCATCFALYGNPFLAIDQKHNFLYLTHGAKNVLKIDLSTNLMYKAAGSGVQYGNGNGDGGLATQCQVVGAQKIATDSIGNIYFSQNFLDTRIRKIDFLTGKITTVVGGNSTNPGLDGSLAVNASIPNSVFTVDAAGNIYYSDNNKIRKVDAKSGILSTIAGNGMMGQAGDGGLAINAQLTPIWDISFDKLNNIYLLINSFTIRKINATDLKINTIAGVDGSFGSSGDSGMASLAIFNHPISINTDNNNNIYIVDDLNFSIRKIDANSGIISKIIGASTFSGDGGNAINANISEPGSMVMDKAGNIIFSDYFNGRVRKFNPITNIITTIAGNGSNVIMSSADVATKNAVDIPMIKPIAIALDSSQNLIIADNGARRIYRVDLSTNKVKIIAGIDFLTASTNPPIGDGGDARNANLAVITGLGIDNNNNIYLADQQYNIIRKIDSKTNIISTIVGHFDGNNPQNGFSGDGGLALNAKIFYPKGISFDGDNNLYFSDFMNQVIRKVNFSTGIISTIAGTPGVFQSGMKGDGGQANEAFLYNPLGGFAFDKKKSILYFSDNDNNVIRRIDIKTNLISTLVGTGLSGYNGDSLPSNTKISINGNNVFALMPTGLVIDSIGNLYFSDSHNNLVRKVIDPYKVIAPIIPDSTLPRKITIHNDKFISLLMSQADYDQWVKEDFYSYDPERIKLIKDVYNRFKDNFDFVVTVLNKAPTGPTKITYLGENVPVSNKNVGIGRDLLDMSSAYGALNGRLKSMVQLADPNYIIGGPFLHELEHTFANFCIDTVGFFGNGLSDNQLRAHWGITGGSTPGQLGGFQQSSLKENINGISNKYSVKSFGQIANGGNSQPYSEFELYLMGMIPSDSVKNFDVFRGIQNFTDSNNLTTFIANSRTTYSKAKIESSIGIRSPSSLTSQKDFNALFVVLTPTPLTPTEIKNYDDQITQMTKKGDDGSSSYNFWEATKGSGTLNANGLTASLASGTIVQLDSNVCKGTLIRFRAYPLINGGILPSYQWYKNGKVVSGENLNLFSANDLINNDTISCKIKNSIDSVIASIIIKSIILSPLAPITTSLSYCLGANAIPLKANITVGNTLLWYGANAIGGVSSVSAPIPSTGTAGLYNYYVSQKDSLTTCESPRNTFIVIVNALPSVANITGATSLCVVTTTTLSNTTTGGVWNSATPTTATISATGVLTGIAVGTSVISYTVTNSNGCVKAMTQTDTVNTITSKPSITRDVNNNLVSSAILGNQWYTDTTAIIAGQTAQSYKPSLVGYYAVKVTLNNCSSPFSDKYYYLVTALANLSNGQFIHLYPNPVSNDLIIDYNLTGQTQITIKILDVNGKIVITKNKLSKGSKVLVAQLTRGIYFVQVIDKNNQLLYTDKLIKE